MRAAQRRAGQTLKIKPLSSEAGGGRGKSQDLFGGGAGKTRRVMNHKLQENINVDL